MDADAGALRFGRGERRVKRVSMRRQFHCVIRSDGPRLRIDCTLRQSLLRHLTTKDYNQVSQMTSNIRASVYGTFYKVSII